MKILFAGSPHSSAQILGAMSAMDLQIIGVISQPDKRSKRAKGEEPSHVSSEAARLGIPLYKPKTIDEKFKAEILKLNYDFLVVSAYGKILPDWLLDSPRISPINIHFSLLPKYRGASPIQAAILNGDAETGISIMKMTAGMDEGPVYSFHRQEILASDNKDTLEKKLTSLCISNIKDDLKRIYTKELIAKDQSSNNIYYCKKIGKLSGEIKFSEEKNSEIMQKHKAYLGWPGVFFSKNNLMIKIHGLADHKAVDGEPTTKKFNFTDKGLVVKTMDSFVVITHLQFPGKRIISSLDAANSHASFFEE